MDLQEWITYMQFFHVTARWIHSWLPIVLLSGNYIETWWLLQLARWPMIVIYRQSGATLWSSSCFICCLDCVSMLSRCAITRVIVDIHRGFSFETWVELASTHMLMLLIMASLLFYSRVDNACNNCFPFSGWLLLHFILKQCHFLISSFKEDGVLGFWRRDKGVT